MRTCIALLCFIAHSCTALAQVNAEWSAGQVHFQHFSFVESDLDSNGRFNFFGSTLYRAYYQNPSFNFVNVEAQLSMSIVPGLGVALGTSFDGRVPIVSTGLNLEWANKSEEVYIACYPVVQWADRSRLDIFAIGGYEPKVKRTFAGFYQGVFGFNRHLFTLTNSEAIRATPKQPMNIGVMLRLGINWRNKCQFGIAIDADAESNVQQGIVNIGLFFRIRL